MISFGHRRTKHENKKKHLNILLHFSLTGKYNSFKRAKYTDILTCYHVSTAPPVTRALFLVVVVFVGLTVGFPWADRTVFDLFIHWK